MSGPSKQLSKEEELEQRFNDLIEYLTWKGILHNSLEKMENWQDELYRHRRDMEREHRIQKAKRQLEQEGYIVVQNENEIDAARVKRWVLGNEAETQESIFPDTKENI